MKCEEFREKLDAFVSGTLPEGEKEKMEEHMRECEECRTLYKMELFLRKELSEISPEPPSPLQFIKEVAAKRRAKQNLRRRAFQLGFAFATVMLIAVIAFKSLIGTKEAVSAELQPAIVTPADGDVVLPDEAGIVLFVPDPRYNVNLNIDGEPVDIKEVSQNNGNVIVAYPPEIEPGYHYAELECYDPVGEKKIVQSAVFYVVGEKR